LRRLLRGLGYTVRWYERAGDFLRAEFPDGPACLVLDVRLPDTCGLKFYQELGRLGLEIPTIFLATTGDIRTAVRAMRAGAEDYITKPCEFAELAHALTRALSRADGERQARSERDQLKRRAAALTVRERDVVRLVLGGMLNKEVAERLELALITVKVHRGRAMKKLGARNAAELARIAHLTGLAKHNGHVPRTCESCGAVRLAPTVRGE
jgi:FixJ family two-component response regulator